jgi:hypothetical protein
MTTNNNRMCEVSAPETHAMIDVLQSLYTNIYILSRFRLLR